MPLRALVRIGCGALCLCAAGCAFNAGADKTAAAAAVPAASPEYRKAVQLADTGHNAEAIKILEQTVSAQPKNAAAWNRLGMLYRAAGRFNDARAAYASALDIDPDYTLAHRNLGILLDIYLQQPQQALEHYRAYAQLAGAQDAEAALWVAELQQRLHLQPAAGEGGP